MLFRYRYASIACIGWKMGGERKPAISQQELRHLLDLERKKLNLFIPMQMHLGCACRFLHRLHKAADVSLCVRWCIEVNYESHKYLCVYTNGENELMQKTENTCSASHQKQHRRKSSSFDVVSNSDTHQLRIIFTVMILSPPFFHCRSPLRWQS